MKKQPTAKRFEKLMNEHGGNISKVAKALGVSRTAIYKWMYADPGLKEIMEDSRGEYFDELLDTARWVALGIPELDETGNRIGWTERPDKSMLRYLLGILGRKEGFGENIDITTNGKDINSVNLFRVLTKEEIDNFDEHFDENY